MEDIRDEIVVCDQPARTLAPQLMWFVAPQLGTLAPSFVNLTVMGDRATQKRNKPFLKRIFFQVGDRLLRKLICSVGRRG